MVLDKSHEIYSGLKDKIRIEIDERDEYTPGWKFNEWEMKGVPVRIEIGPRDIQKQQVVLVRRDTGEKIFVSESELLPKVQELLEDIQQNMFNKAKSFMQQNIRKLTILKNSSRL